MDKEQITLYSKTRILSIKKAEVGRCKASFHKLSLVFPVSAVGLWGPAVVSTASVGSHHALSDLLEICTDLLKTLRCPRGTVPAVHPIFFLLFFPPSSNHRAMRKGTRKVLVSSSKVWGTL